MCMANGLWKNSNAGNSYYTHKNSSRSNSKQKSTPQMFCFSLTVFHIFPSDKMLPCFSWSPFWTINKDGYFDRHHIKLIRSLWPEAQSINLLRTLNPPKWMSICVAFHILRGISHRFLSRLWVLIFVFCFMLHCCATHLHGKEVHYNQKYPSNYTVGTNVMCLCVCAILSRILGCQTEYNVIIDGVYIRALATNIMLSNEANRHTENRIKIMVR